MTPEQLWEKHRASTWDSPEQDFVTMTMARFLTALTEYGELVKASAVKVCYDADKSTHPSDLAAAIEKMELP